METKSTRVAIGNGRYRYRVQIFAEPTPQDGPQGLRALCGLARLLADHPTSLLTAGRAPDTVSFRYGLDRWSVEAEKILVEGD